MIKYWETLQPKNIGFEWIWTISSLLSILCRILPQLNVWSHVFLVLLKSRSIWNIVSTSVGIEIVTCNKKFVRFTRVQTWRSTFIRLVLGFACPELSYFSKICIVSVVTNIFHLSLSSFILLSFRTSPISTY